MSEHGTDDANEWCGNVTFEMPTCSKCGSNCVGQWYVYGHQSATICFDCVANLNGITPAIAAVLADFCESQLNKLPPEKDAVYRKALAELRGMR